jgi:hypothetical protein
MAGLPVSFEAGVYVFDGFRHGGLADTVACARLRRDIEANERLRGG